MISLAQLRQNDPRAYERGREHRFLCPLADCAGKRGRSLSVNSADGVYLCFRCGAKGRLAEWLPPRNETIPQQIARLERELADLEDWRDSARLCDMDVGGMDAPLAHAAILLEQVRTSVLPVGR